MIPNGIYLLTIVEVDCCRAGLRIEFDVDLESCVISKTFSTVRPAMSLRSMLEACGKKIPYRRVRLNLDSLIGLDCSGMVIGGQIIEFYPESMCDGSGMTFLSASLCQVPQYVM